jgi:hypothetical protein
LTFEAENGGPQNLLLYKFGTNMLQNVPMEALCDVNRIGAGIGVFLTDQSNNRIYLPDFVSDPFRTDSMPPARREIPRASPQHPIVLRVDETYALSIEFKFPQLPEGLRGKYYLRLVYYSGVGIYDRWVVGESQIRLDRKFWDATPFQGCTSTNTIKVFFE